MHSRGTDKLIECPFFEGDDIVGQDILLAEDGVEVVNELHGYELMRQLIVILV